MSRPSHAILLCLALLVSLDRAAPARRSTTVEAAGARLDRWEVIGPGGGGTMTHPTISPHDPKLVLVGCDMTGAYITYDGGESWRMINLGTGVSSFAFDPVHPGRHLCGQPGALAQQRSRADVAHGVPRSESPHPRADGR